MRIKLLDRHSTYKTSQREYTDEGFLRVPGKVARTGIQEYRAGELQLDGDPMRVVKVMRLPEEVFAPESLTSLDGVDLTIDHPQSGRVDSGNFKDVVVGTIKGPGRRDGDYVVADIIIKDADAIKMVEAGLVELSCGYSAEYDFDVPDDVDYEAVQRGITHNHVSLVDNARAGYKARISDKAMKRDMMKITLDSGKSVEIEDNASATLVADSIERYQSELGELRDENAKLKKLTSDSAIKAKVVAITKTIDAAKVLCGKKFSCDSMDIGEIQRKALSEKYPSIDWADKGDMYVQGVFDTKVLDAEMKKDEEDRKHKDRKKHRDEDEEEMMEDADYEDEDEEEMKDRKHKDRKHKDRKKHRDEDEEEMMEDADYEDEDEEEMKDRKHKDRKHKDRRKHRDSMYRNLAADSRLISSRGKISFSDKRKQDLQNAWKKGA